MSHFDIDADKEYEFAEIRHKISRVLAAMYIAQDDQIQTTLDAHALKSLIEDLVAFVNNRVPGVFQIVSAGEGYDIRYTSESELN